MKHKTGEHENKNLMVGPQIGKRTKKKSWYNVETVLPGARATLCGVCRMILPSNVRHGSEFCSKNITFSASSPK